MSSSSPVPKFKVEPVETTAKSSRRFVPQPIETTTISSRSRGAEAASCAPPRISTPQPIETTTLSSKRRDDIPSPAPPKFTPQLVHTKKGSRHQEDDKSVCPVVDAASKDPAVSNNKVKRSFVPQLVDTAKRTRKAGDTRPAHLPSDRTDALPSSLDGLRQFRQKVLDTPPPPENTPAGMLSPYISSAEARRLGIPLPRRQISQSTQASTRQHSFRVPELECIDSSESEDNESPCMSTSPSSASDVSFRHATRMRESVDASSSGYMLELAAKAAERQLRDQALAAFPNDDRHTPVDHYIGRESSTAASVAGTRSEFDHRHFGSFNWDLKDMRQHHEQLEAKKEKEQAEREARRNRLHRDSNHGPWGNPFAGSVPGKTKQRDIEMERMHRRARPPMLGNDIEFPRCRSPSPARFDVTQGSTFLRAQMCYLTEHADDPEDCEESLWKVKESSTTVRTSMWSQSSSRDLSPGGLWGGCCRGGTGLSPPRGPTGLMTPYHVYEEAPNPMDTIANPMFRQNPPSPPPSNSEIVLTEEKVDTEQAIEDEFDDEFVSQVYNYLSLGYPSLARKYDDELSKISCTPLSDLRHDDKLATSRGYIRLGDDECGEKDGIDEEMCARWRALRTYIHEWARQQPRMAQPQNQQGFGASVRRGSWAW